MEKSINVIQSIQRAINILNCFNQNELELSLNVISEKVKLNINTTRGLVNSLVANKLIYHNKKNNTYSIGDYFLIKSNLVLNNNMNRAKELSRDLLDLLSQKFHVSSRLQIITDDSIFTALTVDPQNSHYILTSTKSLNFPLHATSSGKLFLCYKKKDLSKIKLEKFTKNTIINIEKLKEELDKIKKNKYSTEIDEIGFGVSSIAVPIFDWRYSNEEISSIFGTISVTALTPIIKKLKLDIIKELKKIVKTLEMRLFESE